MTILNQFSVPDNSFWAELKFQPNDEQLYQLIQLQKQLKYWNKKVNLSRLIEGDDYWISQVFDSLWPLTKEIKSYPEESKEIIDVGSGCGFPGLAIAIAMPSAKITLLDSTKRKTDTLVIIIKELGLNTRVRVINQRVELTGKNPIFREKFDICMARAVAEPAVVAEYLVPLIKTEGRGLIYRGKWNKTDENSLKEALFLLNSKINSVKSINLPLDKGKRNLIIIEKIDQCPSKYPRKIGIPTKKPLGS
tara:strand:- start:1857 stop:2603 length:747 start_codon:yes stop_codon:yes gene_type:complete